MQSNAQYENVFESATTLQKRYSYLKRTAQLPRNKTNDRRKIKEAKQALDRLERNLLKSLTPNLLREVIVSEVYVHFPNTQPRLVLMPRLLELAATSAEAAKRFAYLLIKATFFCLRPPGDEHEAPEGLVITSFTARAMMECGQLIRSSYLGKAYGYIARLIEATQRRDERARWCLEMLYLTALQYGYNLEPVPESVWSEDHSSLLEASGNVSPSSVAKKIRLPFMCPVKHAALLKTIFNKMEREALEETRLIKDLAAKVAAIPARAFQLYLSEVWSEIAASTDSDHSVVLSDGRDKVAVKVPGLSCSGLTSFAFVREDPTTESGWCTYPQVHINLFWNGFGERSVTRLTIAADGELQGFERPSWPIELQRVLYCIIFDAYAQIVLPKYTGLKEQNEQAAKRSKQARPRRRKEGETVSVHPHFRRLAAGWQASEEQVERSLKVMGRTPPVGMTFVDEFDRDYPGPTAQQSFARNAWDAHDRLIPRIVYTGHSLDELLTEVRLAGL